MDPFNPIVNQYLIDGYGKPRLINGLLYMDRISDRPFKYFRDCVNPKPTNKSLPFSQRLLQQLYDLSKAPVEYVGSFSFIEESKEMVMTWKTVGDRYSCSTNFKWRYMFHTHPIEANIPYSFYSTHDIGTYYKLYTSESKNYLTTETGLFSIQLSPQHIKIPLMYLQKIHNYMMSKYISRDNVYVTLYEMIDYMNRLDGKSIYDILCTEQLLNADEYRELSREIIDIGNIYYVNFKEWSLILQDGFIDYYY